MKGWESVLRGGDGRFLELIYDPNLVYLSLIGGASLGQTIKGGHN